MFNIRWRQFTMRSLVGLMFTAGVFFAGYRVGSQHAQSRVDKEFDDIIELITSTITPETWNDVGGVGTISTSEFRTICTVEVSESDSETANPSDTNPFASQSMDSDPFADNPFE